MRKIVIDANNCWWNHIKRGTKQNIIYLDLDQREFRKLKNADQLESLIENKTSGIKGLKYLFIDEIQNVDKLEDVIINKRKMLE